MDIPKFGSIIAVIILIVSLVLLFDKLFTPQPIQIALESGQEITTQAASYFGLPETLLLIICAFFIGSTATYLFYNSDKTDKTNQDHLKTDLKVSPYSKDAYELILPFLKEDERRLLQVLKQANGELLQNQLVLKLDQSKVKVTRILSSLEQKKLIKKERQGLTNNIKLAL